MPTNCPLLMNKMFKILRIGLAIAIFCLLVTACSTSKRGITGTAKNSKSKVEDFVAFYDKFHKDMEFQRSRTKFPLEGKLITEGKEFKWTPENLPLMKVKIYDVDMKTYKISYEKRDNSFFQKIWLPGSGFKSEAKFELIDKKWYLVYVLDQNF